MFKTSFRPYAKIIDSKGKKMKKIMYLVLTALMLTCSFNNFAFGVTIKVDPVLVESMTQEQKEARLRWIGKRVEDIKLQDKSSLTRQDKKSLRQELRSLRKEAMAMSGGGVFLTVGSLLLVILLLIVLL